MGKKLHSHVSDQVSIVLQFQLSYKFLTVREYLFNIFKLIKKFLSFKFVSQASYITVVFTQTL